MEVRCLFDPKKICPSDCPCHADAAKSQRAKSNQLGISEAVLLRKLSVYAPIAPDKTIELSPLNDPLNAMMCVNLNKIQ